MNSAHNQSRNDKRFLGALLCAGIFAAWAGGCAAETDDAGDSTEEDVASESSEAITYIARASVVDPMACAKTKEGEYSRLLLGLVCDGATKVSSSLKGKTFVRFEAKMSQRGACIGTCYYKY